MAYTSNKNMPRIRQQAAHLVALGWSARKVGRYLGFHHTAVRTWVKKEGVIGYHPIPTRTSKPHTHSKKLRPEIEKRIIDIRLAYNRYGKAIHAQLLQEGMHVSIASVNRTLDRYRLLKKKSRWKRFHPHQDRPKALRRGDLVQIDTIHRMISEKKRLYVFALIDVYSRTAHAKAFERINGKTSISFIKEAERVASFKFEMVQSDHGPEFSKWFVSQVKKNHRYTRIGKPNDNAHIERFNRTLQEECLDKYPNDVSSINRALKKYLRYYNSERLHAGINFKTPAQVV